MSITKADKKDLISKFATKEKDTGSAEVQCAILTKRIKNLTEHFKTHKNDFHSRRGLLILIGKRKRLLSYIKNRSTEEYQNLIKQLGIRR